jgi:hypothetical protein
MLDQLSQCQHCGGGGASSQSLILQAIWCLEDACETHGKLMNRGNTTTADRQALEVDAIFIGHNIRQALKGLLQLHDLLYRHQLYGDDDSPSYSLPEANPFPSIKTLTSLRRPILGDPGSLFRKLKIRPKPSAFQPFLNANADANRVFGDYISKKFNNSKQQKAQRRKEPKVDGTLPSENGLNESALVAVSEFLETKIPPIMLDVELKDESGEAINMNVRISDASFQPQYKIHEMSRQQSDAFTEMVRSRTQVEDLPTCEKLQPYISASQKTNLMAALKTIRQFFERQWESESHAFSSAVAQCLEACERNFRLIRDQTTDSIWNVEHQEHRTEVFERTDVGFWYRQKCTCVGDALHSLDVYCPRNMSFEVSGEDEELEWDEDLQEWRKKKTPRPTSPAESESDEDEDPYDAEAERLAKEKELAETREKIMAEIKEMVGLDNVKDHLHKIATRVETSNRQGVDLKEERFGTVFIGNPGTGTSTPSSPDS